MLCVKLVGAIFLFWRAQVALVFCRKEQNADRTEVVS